MLSGLNSTGELLQLFRRGAVSTRSELQQATGLARSTVTYKIDALLASQYLVEDGSIGDGRGRPATRLRVNDRAATVLVADLGMTHGRLAVSTAGGEVLAETVIESSIDKGPETVLATVFDELEAMLAGSGRERSTLRGVGLGLPGPIDWQTGRVARSLSMPSWDHYPVRERVADHFAVTVAVDNDANLLGLGEQRRVYPNAHLILFVKVGTGVGSSLIIDGEVLRGSDSVEGDIGHAKIPGIEETCSSCGARGCLAATASGRAMVRDLRRLGLEPVTARDVVDLVRVGNPDAVRVVTAAGAALGDVLSTAVSLLNPDLVVIGGDIAQAHEHFLLGVRQALLSRCQPLATAQLRIAPSQLGAQAGIAGAATMVADAVFGSDAVDAVLA